MDVFHNEDTFVQLVDKLDKYELQNPAGRQMFMHGVLTHANLRKVELRCGEKKTALNALTGVHDLEGETVHVCTNSLMCLFCIGPHTWKKLQKDAMLPNPKNTENYEDNVNKSSSCTQRIIDYLYEIFREEGETHATRIVRLETKVGLRDHDYSIMHLPSYYIKRKLYEQFCYVSGWEIKSASDGSYPPITQFPKRMNDNTKWNDDTSTNLNDDTITNNMSLWPEGSESLPVCSWHSFLRIWKSYMPNLKIRSPSLDTCDLCNEYAKYMGSLRLSQMESLPTFVNNDPLICPETGEESILDKGFGDLQECRENVVLLAGKHIAAAQAQKRLAESKVEAANNSIHTTNSLDKTVTLVIDFCQNLDLPHLG